MKNLLFATGLLGALLFASCSSPNAEDILRSSYEKCQSIENGYYEMTQSMKYMSDQDTSTVLFTCHFKKLPEDSIFSSAFHYLRMQDGYTRGILYTGEDFVNYSIDGYSGVLKSKTLWADDIKSYRHNYTFYSPLTQRQSNPMPDDSALLDPDRTFELVGEEMINNTSCYHIKMNIVPVNDSADFMQTIRNEINFWISKKDYIPLQYTIVYDVVEAGDTMSQYEKYALTKYEINNLVDEKPLTLASIPSEIKLEDYQPHETPELLSNNSIAPDWSLVSLNDQTVKLSDLKGKLVLIDFFYKSCAPCMKALPALQDLHERYAAKGLEVIGIDPYDTKEKDNIDTFLAKRGITYTVLLGGKEVAKEYQVSGYPTMYLIGKKGEILFTQIGYGEGVEKEIEEIIKKNL